MSENIEFGPEAVLPLPKGTRWSAPALSGIDDWSALYQLRARELYLSWEIEDDEDEEAVGVSNLIRSLRMLDNISSDPITVFVNSPGGDIATGMALICTMRDLRSPVRTHVVGQAASMSAVVAIAGAERTAYPTARWLLHRGKSMAGGDHEDLAIAAKELKVVDSYADQVILNFSKIPESRLSRLQRKDYWLGTEDALKWGLVDRIVVPRGTPEGVSWLPDQERIKKRQAEADGEDTKSE